MANTAPFFDAHTHVHFAAFKDDRREAVQRAADADVSMITVGTQLDTSRLAVTVANEFPERVFATVGLHPIHTEASYHDTQELGDGQAAEGFTSRAERFDLDSYRKLAHDPQVVAIGECGLDYYRLEEHTKEKQMAALEAQVALAAEVKKPLMIHCRKAFADLILFLGSRVGSLRPSAGVVHFFSGRVDDARLLMELGFSFTFGGVLTFSRDYDDAVRFLPLDHILSETDAPYVAPEPYRGKRNEPAYVVEVVKKLAALKGMSEEKMREQIWANGRRIFGLTR